MTRGAYGADEIYTRMAVDSLVDWQALSAARPACPSSIRPACCSSSRSVQPYPRADDGGAPAARPADASCSTGRRCARRFPQIDFTGIEAGLFEPGFGALMARRAVQTLVAEFVRAGGDYRAARIAPPARRRRELTRCDRRWRRADRRGRSSSSPAGRGCRGCSRTCSVRASSRPGRKSSSSRRRPAIARFGPHAAAGLGRLQRRRHVLRLAGPRGARLQDRARHARAADRSGHWRPHALAGSAGAMSAPSWRGASRAWRTAPLNEARVCQYENSSNGDFLIDRHPRWTMWCWSARGSGHGFKHGPAVGRYAAELLAGHAARPPSRASAWRPRRRSQRATVI